MRPAGCGPAGREKRMDNRFSVDVIIPVFQPDRRFARLLMMLEKQTYPVNRIIAVNTEKRYWNDAGYQGIDNLSVHHVTKEQFDHGASRNLGAGFSKADIMIFMTDDAVPQDTRLVERLAAALNQKGPEGERTAMAYARQIPAKDCRTIERYTRDFNYPAESRIKTKADLPKLGIKTYFASNVCCGYWRDIFEQQGGFISRTIFNEDMIYAAGVIQKGYAVAYAADARVVHSHNLTFMQQFRRNFDLAVSQADHPEVFEGLPAEGEGIRLVKRTAGHLLRNGRFWLLPSLIIGSGCKYAGYRLGKMYRMLPPAVISFCTANPAYWEKRRNHL